MASDVVAEAPAAVDVSAHALADAAAFEQDADSVLFK